MYYEISESDAKKIPCITNEQMEALQKKYGKYLISEFENDAKRLKSEVQHIE